jgi:tRNA-splicing ligase RtcB (3'-phosphate/5'-hydroxy nucleic acid ligase)
MPYQEIKGVPVWGDPQDNAVDQILNCARDAEAAALMADHHLGYAVPIGGVVAYGDKISPSGVGYDIACLEAGTLVTLVDGRRLRIEEVVDAGNLLGCDYGRLTNVGTTSRLSEKVVGSTLKITAESGDTLCLTEDHLLLTPEGWKAAGSLNCGEMVAVSSYIGIESNSSSHLDYRLLRLFGYAVGDGHLTLHKNRVSFYSSKDEDADQILTDLHALGWRNANIHWRIRANGSIENNIYCSDRELHTLFSNWGLSPGKSDWAKADLTWLCALPNYLIAAFLGGLFSAEMAAPLVRNSRLIGNPSMKQGGLNPLPLLEVVQQLLEALGFTSRIHPSGKPYNDRQTYVLMVLGGQQAAVRLWRILGFPYAKYKQRKAAEAMSIVWQRDQNVRERVHAKDICLALRAQGVGVYELADRIAVETGQPFTHSMALKALYEDRATTRVSGNYQLIAKTDGDFVWSPIQRIEDRIGETKVYDIPLTHDAHNFIAGGVVAHNCGNKAVRLDIPAEEVKRNISTIMDDIWRTLSFGVGLKNNQRVDHELFDDVAWQIPIARQHKTMAQEQLGTIGSGNHYVDIFEDEQGQIWVGVHFGSRGLGHRLATHFIKAGGGKDGINVDPVLLSVDSQLGQEYLACMHLGGRYAYAGRDWVAQHVAKLLGARILEEVHNHHNFTWQEQHNGEKLWVVRKGATPAFPGQLSFVGGSMGDISVILEGVESDESRKALYSTVHGAGRVMSRTQAAGRVRWQKGRKIQIKEGEISRKMMMDWVNEVGVELRGAGTDESPHCYKRLPEVLAHHEGTVRVVHTLRPLGVAMAGEGEHDPYKD